MDNDMDHVVDLSPDFVRDQLDEILAKEITKLLDVDSNSAMMSFNLAGISCITLLIEKEKEIKQYADFPPERYTQASFINEMVDIGLENDESLKKAFKSVLSNGYASEDSDGSLKAEMPAFMMTGFLDNMFPGMQGMNLVAFILQMNDEVNSGRKTLNLAKDSFASALKSRGVSVSKNQAEKKTSEIVTGNIATSIKSKSVSKKLKKANLNRLSSLIKKRKKRTFESPSQLKIKDVFDKGPTKEELEAQKDEIKRADQEAQYKAELARELADKDEKIKRAQEVAQKAAKQLEEIEQREKQLEKVQQETQKANDIASELEAREADMAEKESQLKALEERLKQTEEQKKIEKEQEKEKKIEEKKREASNADDDIESRIAAFEVELTMSCPLCKDGEINSKKTEMGKEFFSCTKPDCRFVSWDKPYHFECPLCKNSYLTEITTSNGEKGLKCPRATCSFTQNNLFDPRQNLAKTVATNAPPKKKKRVVRRKRRK